MSSISLLLAMYLNADEYLKCIIPPQFVTGMVCVANRVVGGRWVLRAKKVVVVSLTNCCIMPLCSLTFD